MIKKLIYAIISLFLVELGYAQPSNSIRVGTIVSPNNSTTFQPNDSTEFTIQIVNDGPNDLIAGDQFRLSYSLSNASGETMSADTLLQVGSPTLRVGMARLYVIDSNLRFNGADLYSICADLARGTVIFPVNLEKFSNECRVFTVNIDEVDLKVNQLYYAEGNVHLSLARQANYAFEVFTITGKLLLRQSAKNVQDHTIKLPTTTKGIYLLKILAPNGESLTSKFTVH